MIQRRLLTHGLRSVAGVGALLVCLLAPLARAEDIPADSTPRERELGDQAAAEVAKRYKFVDDEANLKKLTHMARVLGLRSERPKIEYVVKILKDDTLNAFTIPGGHVYFTSELVKSARTDHELAGVMAHEIAHNARLHVLKLIAKQRKLQVWQLLAVVGMAAGGDAGADIGQMALMVLNGILNGYSVAAEKEADEAAVTYLLDSGYSPVGLLTFMEYLHDREQRRPSQGDPGIYQTHPLTEQRIHDLTALLEKNHIPLNRRLTAGGPAVTVDAPENDDAHSTVWIGGSLLCKLADNDTQSRGNRVATRLRRALREGRKMYSLSVQTVAGVPAVVWGGELIVQVTAADHFNDQPAEALARHWLTNLRKALWHDSIQSGR